MTTHILTTRFNVRFAHSLSSSAQALSLPWIMDRVALFEKYCLPSVAYQTVKPDVWIIWLDEHSPQELRQRATSWQAICEFIRPVYVGPFDVPIAVKSIREQVAFQADWLLTSRLDNDDAIHPRFIETLRHCVVEGRKEFLNVPQGLVIADGKCYRKSMTANPFIALSESCSDPLTVWAEQHGLLGRLAPVRQIPLRDGWIQVVHGGNLSNTVRGWRVPSSWLDRRFMPIALDAELRDDGWAEILTDNTVGLYDRYKPAITNLLGFGRKH